MAGPARAGVLIYAKDLLRLSRFYQRLLGMHVVHEGPEHHVIESDDMQLIVHAIPAHIAKDIHIATPPVPREEQAIKPFFTVASLAAAAGVLGEFGCELVGPEYPGPGIRTRNAFDPEGNIIHLREVTG